jgi:DNA mismatch repair protein MutL
VVQGIPAGIDDNQTKKLFEGLMDQFKQNQAELALPVKENLARSLAKRAAIKAGEKLTPEAMQALVANLMACKAPGYSPDGETTYFIFDLAKIGMYFRQK